VITCIQEGVDAERLEKGLFAVRNSFRSLFHSVDVRGLMKHGTSGNRPELRLSSGALLAALFFYLLKKTYD